MKLQIQNIECLVYNKTNWMDSLTTAEVNAKKVADPSFTAKYNARYIQGDIIEVREVGYWTDGIRAGFGAPNFVVITVPSVKMIDARKYMEPAIDWWSDPTGLQVWMQRRYNIDLSKVVVDAKGMGSISSTASIQDKTLWP